MSIHSGSSNAQIQVDDLTASVHAAEEGGYRAEVPALPGCLTQSETLDEVGENLNDAIEGWLSVRASKPAQGEKERGSELLSLVKIVLRTKDS